MDPFRKAFLDHAEIIMTKQPSKKSHLELLKLATAGLTSSDLNKPGVLRALKLRLHPDKHPQEKERATRLFQAVSHFCDACKNPSKKTSVDADVGQALPFQFHSQQDKWPHMSFTEPYYEESRFGNNIDGELDGQVATLVAYQCINARGAIAHGKSISIKFTSQQILQTEPSERHREVEVVFEDRGGYKVLETVPDIKQEIFSRGPVVSASFSFKRNDAYFFPNLKQFVTQKSLLIVGWKPTETGEAWLVQPLGRPDLKSVAAIPIGLHQFAIDDLCLAPVNSFEDTPWEPGPYLDLDLTQEVAQVWRNWKGIDYSLSVEASLELIK